MAVLQNAKHERFAQGLAKGMTADEAYVSAGFKANRGNAATLKAKQNVADRVAELLERAAAKTGITVASITERLLGLADVAEKTGISTDEETGEIVGSSSKHLSVARAALMDAAKLNGLVVERGEYSGPGGAPIPINAITTAMTAKEAAEAYEDTLHSQG